MNASRLLITGADGQMGRALKARYPQAQATTRASLDITDQAAVQAFDWSSVDVIINAAAYTNVDGAEKAEGRQAAWQINAQAVGYLAAAAQEHDLTLVHLSTEYVFDGSQSEHSESEKLTPLSVYGASKAAGDLLVEQVSKHYLLRTSWVIGEGANFVRTMFGLGQKAVSPTVVADQVGRLTFTSELVRAIDHLLSTQVAFGTYNISNGGRPASWAAITRVIFTDAQFCLTVTDTTTADYYADKDNIAPRPLNSILSLAKLQATGFEPHDWQDDLHEYIVKELAA